MVIAPKALGDVGLCVDMRMANAAFIRERVHIPTVDEVLESLNGSTELRLGCHQIELDKGSRDITTFATHDALFSDKRLSFGKTLHPRSTSRL